MRYKYVGVDACGSLRSAAVELDKEVTLAIADLGRLGYKVTNVTPPSIICYDGQFGAMVCLEHTVKDPDPKG